MKNLKRISLCLALFTLFTVKGFSLGAGVQLGFCPAVNYSLTDDKAKVAADFSANIIGSIRLFRVPAQFGFGFQLNQDAGIFDYGINGIGDYILFQVEALPNWSIYTLMGVNGAIHFNSRKENVIHAGGRLGFGYSWIFRDNYLELFTQVACNPLVEWKNGNPSLFKINIPVETGFRFHF